MNPKNRNNLVARVRRLQIESLENRWVLSAAFPEFVDPNPSPGNRFGTHVVPLSTGNVVVTSPLDNFNGTQAGAVYLFNGETGSLISTLRGPSAFDQVGIGGIRELANGNFLVLSPNWDGQGQSALGGYLYGAVTFGNGNTGISGNVSSANSLVGSQDEDRVGGFADNSFLALSNGNYVFTSSFWDNGTKRDAGATTFGNGTVGVSGEITSSNSLLGNRTRTVTCAIFIDEVGNSNYIVRRPCYSSGSESRRGAITFGDGTTGVTGSISTSNSLIGNQSDDRLGDHQIRLLANGNYVVFSKFGGTGSVTWGDGNSGVTGIVTASNSLVGAANAYVGGFISPVTALSNGNYVVGSYWTEASGDRVVSFTFSDGSTAITGTSASLTIANSLISPADPDTSFRNVFDSQVVELANGNYVVTMPHLDINGAQDAGAVTLVAAHRALPDWFRHRTVS